MDNAHILQLHPILRSEGVEVYWNDYVGKVNTRGDVQPRHLVITSVGFFLLTKRTFPSGYKISRIIPITRLKTVTLTTDFIALDSETETMVLKHDKINEIAALIITLQTSIMGTTVFKASTHLKLVVSDIVVSVTAKHPTISKFQSECLALNLHIRIDQVNSVCKTFESNSETYTFDPSIAASALMPAIASALKGYTSYRKIILKDLSFMTFFKHFGEILNESTSIKSIVFNRTTFIEKNLSVPTGFFEKIQSPINDIQFWNCDLTNPKFKDLFYEIARIRTNIESLVIDACDMEKSSIEAIFYSLFDSTCFRSLSELVIIKGQMADTIQMFIVQLINSDWILKNKSLKKLVLQNTPLKLESLLNSLTMFETGLVELSLSGCTFKKALQGDKITTFQDLTSIDFSNITTTAAALISLFDCLSTANSQINSLDFTSMKMTETEKVKFYSQISKYKLGNIQTLVWDGNSIPNDLVSNFTDFLALQTNLIDLSISNCIQGDPVNAEYLAKPISLLNLERFVMVGSENYSFRRELNPVIKELVSKSSFTSLDISGHKIGDEGLQYITKFVQNQCKCIVFGKTCAVSVEALMDCLNEIVNSNIEYAVWPTNDIKGIIIKIPLGQRDKTIKEFARLKKEFSKKYESQEDDIQDTAQTSRPMKLQRMSSLPLLSRKRSDSIIPLMDKCNFASLSYKEEKIKTLLTECFGAKSVQSINDPLVVCFNSYSLETSMERFVLH
jgi:hypothetical protein